MKRLNIALLASLFGASLLAAGCSDASAPMTDAADEATSTPAAAPPVAGEASGTTGTDEADQSGQARPRLVAPVRGTATIVHTKPESKAEKDVVITTVRIKNTSSGAIAGLRLEEFWWDKNNNPLPGDAERLGKPLMPNEVVTIELRTPRNPAMFRNNYKFSHANGEVKAMLVDKIDDGSTPAGEAEKKPTT